MANCLYNNSFTPDFILIRTSFQTLALNVNFINASTACNGDPDIRHWVTYINIALFKKK
jgi:hypothetical protein